MLKLYDGLVEVCLLSDVKGVVNPPDTLFLVFFFISFITVLFEQRKYVVQSEMKFPSKSYQRLSGIGCLFNVPIQNRYLFWRYVRMSSRISEITNDIAVRYIRCICKSYAQRTNFAQSPERQF